MLINVLYIDYVSHVEHSWMGQFEDNRRFDHGETLGCLAYIRNNGAIIMDIMASQVEHTRKANTSTMQSALKVVRGVEVSSKIREVRYQLALW